MRDIELEKEERLKRIQLAIKKGFTCNPETGEVFGIKGKLITSEDKDGYKIMQFKHDEKKYYLKAHQFIWYCVHNEISEMIEHKDRNPSNNKIENLQKLSGNLAASLNGFNRGAKGYSYKKSKNVFISSIRINGKYIYIGSYKNESDARNAYLEAKKIYHKI